MADRGRGLGQGQKTLAISDAVRQRALTLVEPLWRNRVRHDAEREVRSLYAKALFRSEVVATLRAKPALSEPVREEAVALAERLRGLPLYFDRASRAVAGRPGAERSAYDLAAQRAELACRLMPFVGSYQTTLGMAQYRLGKYQEALATLTARTSSTRRLEGGTRRRTWPFWRWPGTRWVRRTGRRRA